MLSATRRITTRIRSTSAVILDQINTTEDAAAATKYGTVYVHVSKRAYIFRVYFAYISRVYYFLFYNGFTVHINRIYRLVKDAVAIGNTEGI